MPGNSIWCWRCSGCATTSRSLAAIQTSVMVFGQSGGGAKIATMMAMPLAQGLFHRAATMSGQQVTASGPLNATLRTRAVLDALKLTPERCREIRTLPAERLVEAIDTRDPVLPFGGISFAPVLDERTLHRHPFYPDAPAQSAAYPDDHRQHAR